MELSKMVRSLVTILAVFKPLLISRCSMRFKRNPFLPGCSFLPGRVVYIFKLKMFRQKASVETIILTSTIV